MHEDLDGDGKEEIIFAYNYGGDAYIGVGNYDNSDFKVFDTYKGNGSDISYLNFKDLDKDNLRILVVGFEIRKISLNLDLLSYHDNRLNSILKNKNLYFKKIDIIDFNNNGDYEIVLWSHDTGLAYKVAIYKFKDGDLYETHDYDKLYYKKVYLYYKNLMEQYPNSPIYANYFKEAKNILDRISL